MEQRNGGEPLAPPRPPKSIPLVHRLRATETPMMSAHLNQPTDRQQQILHQNPIATPPRRPTQLTTTQQQLPPAIITAPLSTLLQPVTFSRRRPIQQQQGHQPAVVPASVSPILTLSSNIQNLDITPSSPVTLAAPRPNSERLVNEYVDTPLRLTHSTARIQSNLVSTGSGTVPAIHNNSNLQLQTFGLSNSKTATQQIVPHSTTSPTIGSTTTPTLNRLNRPTALSISTTAITKQPLCSFTKDLSTVLHEDAEIHPTNGDNILNSVSCPTCNRCRCEECQKPRQLPSRWVCDTCLCSAETVIDYISCLCCVKALYYHCSKEYELDRDDGSLSCADDPCSCVSHNRATRWGYLAALSICLPCLWCYWPMRGCVALCAKCYAKHTRHGCRCKHSKLQGQSLSTATDNLQNSSRTNNHHQYHHHHHHNSHRSNELTPEKRLLDSSTEF